MKLLLHVIEFFRDCWFKQKIKFLRHWHRSLSTQTSVVNLYPTAVSSTFTHDLSAVVYESKLIIIIIITKHLTTLVALKNIWSGGYLWISHILCPRFRLPIRWLTEPMFTPSFNALRLITAPNDLSIFIRWSVVFRPAFVCFSLTGQ